VTHTRGGLTKSGEYDFRYSDPDCVRPSFVGPAFIPRGIESYLELRGEYGGGLYSYRHVILRIKSYVGG
jgi:hypothetical protein